MEFRQKSKYFLFSVLFLLLVTGVFTHTAAAFQLMPTGRLHLNYAVHDADNQPLHDRFLVRSARIGLGIRFNEEWSFKSAYEIGEVYKITDQDITRKGTFRQGFKDLFLCYEGWGLADLRLGHFKAPFGLDELNSSNNIAFVERALPTSTYSPSRRLGINLEHNRHYYTASAMLFDAAINGAGGRGVAARLTFSPILSSDSVLHLGAATTIEWPRDNLEFSTEPESDVSATKFAKTGNLTHVKRVDRTGFEAAWRYRAALVQGEWTHVAVSRNHSSQDVDFGGWYVQGSWMLTGETREYKNGIFKGISPNRPKGAWELAVRYSHLDLNDGSIQGGRENNITLGINYYANRYMRIMANAIQVQSKYQTVSDNPRIVLMRMQLLF